MDLKVGNAVIKDVKLVIFDKDGTLMDLYNYWMNMVVYRASIVQKKLGLSESDRKDLIDVMGVDKKNGRLKPEGPVGLKKREIVMQAVIDELARKGHKDTRGICYEAFKQADEASLEHLPDIIRPIDGMNKLIEGLHIKGCKIAVATTDKTKRAEIALGYLGISGKIDIVVGEDMVKNSKPAPDMAELIIEKAGVPKQNTVIVGDAITDIEMGLNAGLLASIGVLSGLTPKEQLSKKTKYIVDDVSGITVK